MNKLKAFTLVEMLAVLALAAILSGILAWLIFWFQSRFFDYQKREDNSLELFFMDKAMRMDLEKTAIIIPEETGFSLQDDKKNVFSSWMLVDSLPVRKTTNTDSFHVKLSSLSADPEDKSITAKSAIFTHDLVYRKRKFAECRIETDDN